jgi:hypothetical protein
MGEIVALKPSYYPLIVRAVLQKEAHYYTKIIEGDGKRPRFFVDDIRRVLGITNDGWLDSAIRYWGDAEREIRTKAISVTHKTQKQVSPVGFFVTVRPRYGEVDIFPYRMREQ